MTANEIHTCARANMCGSALPFLRVRSALAPVRHPLQRLHQFATLKEIARQDYDERCEYENWDASCLETPPMTVKAPFKTQRYRFT